MNDGDWNVYLYIFDDVVIILNGVVFFDWVIFLCECLDGYGLFIGGLEVVGWRLVYIDMFNDVFKVQEFWVRINNLLYLIGMLISDVGYISDVLWDSFVFNVGLVLGMIVLGLDGCVFNGQVFKDVIIVVCIGKVLFMLLVKCVDCIDSVVLDYYDGLKYLLLECIGGRFDCFVELWKL